MATTVHEPPKIGPRNSDVGQSGDGGDTLIPRDGELRAVQYSPPPASTGIWVGLFAITMMFLAFTSALVVRKGTGDWRHLSLPPILYWNTLVLLASSFTLEIFRRQSATGSRGPRSLAAVQWLYVTLGLGLLFVAGQLIAWSQLNAQGLYLASNPSSSFFYVLTAAHGLHVLGGLGGLILVIRRIRRSVLRKSTLDAASRYWHFMDVLWIYLMVLLWMKL